MPNQALLAGTPSQLGVLGVLRAQQGRLREAENLLRHAVRASPEAADLHNNLGMVLFALGRADEAIAAYRLALAHRPGYAVASNNLGMALASLDRHAEAITCYQAALLAQAQYPEALANFGASLHALGRTREAVARFREALGLRPAFTEARVNLGHALAAVDRRNAAIRSYEEALAARPDDQAIHVSLGAALREEGQTEKAADHFRKAIALRPSLAHAHAGLGSALLELGEITEAASCFEQAIALEPRSPSSFLALARAGEIRAGSAHFRAMLDLAQDMRGLKDGEKIELQFALAKALSDAGEHERSFEQLLAGNALKRSAVVYDEADAIGRLDRIRTVFTAELMRARSQCGNSSQAPLFIVGMPRSGSTLVEQIVSSHPAVFGAGETEAFVLAAKDAGLFTAAAPFPDSVASWTDDQLRHLGTRYLGRLKRLARDAGHDQPERIVDKMLFNFRHLGLISLMFPNARVIHMRRNPVDTCLSCFSIHFKSLDFTYDLGELGRAYAAYSRLMEHWRTIVPDGTVLDVEYESLVGDFETEARRIIAHCGLEWSGNCLRFHETSRPVRTASLVQVRQPLNRAGINRWRPEDRILQPLIEGLGPECLPSGSDNRVGAAHGRASVQS